MFKITAEEKQFILRQRVVAASWNVGDRIVVNLHTKNDPEYFIGTVTSVKKNELKVEFDDGDDGTYKPTSKKLFPGNKKKRKSEIPSDKVGQYLAESPPMPSKEPKKTPKGKQPKTEEKVRKVVTTEDIKALMNAVNVKTSMQNATYRQDGMSVKTKQISFDIKADPKAIISDLKTAGFATKGKRLISTALKMETERLLNDKFLVSVSWKKKGRGNKKDVSISVYPASVVKEAAKKKSDLDKNGVVQEDDYYTFKISGVIFSWPKDTVDEAIKRLNSDGIYSWQKHEQGVGQVTYFLMNDKYHKYNDKDKDLNNNIKRVFKQKKLQSGGYFHGKY